MHSDSLSNAKANTRASKHFQLIGIEPLIIGIADITWRGSLS
jgi:hypothetical protein